MVVSATAAYLDSNHVGNLPDTVDPVRIAFLSKRRTAFRLALLNLLLAGGLIMANVAVRSFLSPEQGSPYAAAVFAGALACIAVAGFLTMTAIRWNGK
jgi:hypothetical protein